MLPTVQANLNQGIPNLCDPARTPGPSVPLLGATWESHPSLRWQTYQSATTPHLSTTAEMTPRKTQQLMVATLPLVLTADNGLFMSIPCR